MTDGNYALAHRRSIEDPEGFWGEAARGIDWITQPRRVLDDSRPPFYRWFSGGQLNTCYNALDRHVIAGRGDQPALYYDSPVTGTSRTLTYAQLLDQVSRFGGALRALGVDKGDRVVIYMPMVPEAVVAMLACARIGAVHSVVFGGFAAGELAARIEDAEPKVVVIASCGIETSRVVQYKPLLDAAIERSAHKPDYCVVLQREQALATMGARDLDWDALMDPKQMTVSECVTLEATDPLYILYTSGTTGRPKGIVRDNGGHAVALHWSMSNVYDLHPGEVFWAASDVGWVVGHSYIVYAPLLAGCTTVLYEGKPVGTPDAGALWRVAAQYGVKKEDPDGKLIADYDLSKMRTLFLAGERLDPDTYFWATEHLGMPVVDHWWQTETGWAIAANCIGLETLPIKAGSPTVPVPGYDVRVLDEHGQPVEPGVEGAICIKLPMPPGTLPTLWRDDDRYVSGYLAAHKGFYLTGDGGYLDEDGYLYVMGRTDDVLNVAGHRLSTGSLEAALAGHPSVAECRPGSESRAGPAGPRRGWGRRLVASGRHRRGVTQDPLGQDATQDHAPDRRWWLSDCSEHDRGCFGAGGTTARPHRRAAARYDLRWAQLMRLVNTMMLST